MNEKSAGLCLAGLLGALCLTVSLSLLSCANPGAASGSDGSTSSSYRTLAWQNDGAGYVQYYTNDPANIQSQGYSEWRYYDPSETPMSTVEVKANKISGDASMGFGLIFCVQDSVNFMTVDIDTQGFYKIVKVVAGTYVSIVPWTDSAGALFSGYSVPNTIKVAYDSTSKVFTLYLNRALVTTFTDPSAPYFTGGRNGFIIGISNTENFPR